MTAIQDKWDQRYRERSAPGEPCQLLQQFIDILPAHGRALDLACGLGGNADLLARRGLDCDAVDISQVAVDTLRDYAQEARLPIYAQQWDIESAGLPTGPYQVVVVSHYLHRPLLPQLPSILAPGGLLLYQTFNDAGPVRRGPNKAAFRLQPDELLSHFKALDTLYHRQDFPVGVGGETAFVGRKIDGARPAGNGG
ncbi:class I SAM-dependent methyltransferase [Spongiibacter nanhainus]|uniref:Class I SAM-dependent methyltransferase n=1 Tax=Spongiibacter nanhainus TaxID=2794344 RepID=A0A7T4UQ51_9GAMM|nr:class I SAM-dependent methyltransferase [Spongiibacter nanhainus]QQD18306.1 class I SAM-dependent methyltransferase [Spongiibacter nanhainus]